MAQDCNLPDDFSWRAFDAYYGDDQPPDPDVCPTCGAPDDQPCDDDCQCSYCKWQRQKKENGNG